MSGSKFHPNSNRLVFTFDNEDAAYLFKLWLCESGEQEYWMWQESREQDDDSESITGLDFDYHTGTEEIPVKCGRLDDDR